MAILPSYLINHLSLGARTCLRVLFINIIFHSILLFYHIPFYWVGKLKWTKINTIEIRRPSAFYPVMSVHLVSQFTLMINCSRPMPFFWLPRLESDLQAKKAHLGGITKTNILLNQIWFYNKIAFLDATRTFF